MKRTICLLIFIISLLITTNLYSNTERVCDTSLFSRDNYNEYKKYINENNRLNPKLLITILNSYFTEVYINENDYEEIYNMKDFCKVVDIEKNERNELTPIVLCRTSKNSSIDYNWKYEKICSLYYVDKMYSDVESMNKHLNEIKKKEEKEKKIAIAKDKQQKLDKYNKRRANIEQKHPNWKKTTIDYIMDGSVHIGMTKEQARMAWGNPRRINRTTNIYGTHEQWCYNGGYLYFDNDILTSVQN